MLDKDRLKSFVPARLSDFLTDVIPSILGKDPSQSELSSAQAMALTAFAFRMISAGIAFLSHIVFARLIGQFEYGIYALVWVVAVIIGNLSCFGFHSTQIRFLPVYFQKQEYQLYLGLAFAARLTALTVSAVITTIGLLFLYFFGEKIASYYVIPFALGLFIIPMIALGDTLDGTARANGWPLTAMQFTYLIRPALIISVMLAAVAFGFETSATTAMQAALVATFITSLLQLISVRRQVRAKIKPDRLQFEYRVWMRYSLPIFVTDGIGFLLTNADVIIVGMYLPPDQVAIYFAAAKVIVLMQFIFFAVKAAAGPRFAALFGKGDTAALENAAQQTARWSFWPSLTFGLMLLALGPWLLLLFGEGFSSGYILMVILFLGFLVKSAIGPAETLLNMAGKQVNCMILYTVTFISNISFNVVLIPLYGLIGAAIAAALAMLVETLLLYIVTRISLGIRLTPVPVRASSLAKSKDFHDGR